MDKEKNLIVVDRVKKKIKEEYGNKFSLGKGYFLGLSKKLDKVITESIKRAEANQRTTLLERDV